MTDTNFRSINTEVSTPEVLPSGITSTSGGSNNEIEGPYTEYSKQYSHPYTVDHFQLGDTWDDPQGGFHNEVTTIEDYVSRKIESGEIANSKEAVKEMIKGIEKINNVKKEERAIVKIQTLSAYIDFLNKIDNIKVNLRKYGNTK
jgi:hypothetical protein